MVVICSKSMDWVSVIESGEEVCDGRILNLIFIVWRITGWRGTTCEWLRQGVSHCCWLLHLVASWIVPLLAPPQTHMNRSICCHGNVADMPNGSPIISVLTVAFVPSADDDLWKSANNSPFGSVHKVTPWVPITYNAVSMTKHGQKQGILTKAMDHPQHWLNIKWMYWPFLLTLQSFVGPHFWQSPSAFSSFSSAFLSFSAIPSSTSSLSLSSPLFRSSKAVFLPLHGFFFVTVCAQSEFIYYWQRR